MKYYAIIVAGGIGNRMENSIPKQFLLLGGIPVLMRSIEAFFNSELKPSIILVLHSAHIQLWKELCIRHGFKISHQIVQGGETRFSSVKNGLKLVNNNSITAIHDGARPIVSQSLINKCFRSAEQHGNAIPGVQSSDSIRQLRNGTSKSLKREEIYKIQTPQVFKTEVLVNAYEQLFEPIFSDDASVVEKAGHIIHLVDGESSNIKITYPEDLIIAESLLQLNKKRP
ncbi:MAG TPA: 2-C-methyl-D-erythritol 4-phosphate cytidylyltransferase [Sphingobacteriaceae bacterium]|nr:2-C-methyl-D-erythritol 4-phosphate cytidylyltransferase [Sphingobacteriaceae bacterium]